MSPILECIPNVSEGKNPQVLEKISRAVSSVEGVRLLHQDTGESAHRTVFTFAGTPNGVCEAAFQLIRTAANEIDMRKHRGVHPRMGATDVCPLVPVRGISMEETVVWSHTLAKRVGRELRIPTYLYERSATHPMRKNLASIRMGEYEGFKEKIKDPLWLPDYGPTTFQAGPGQTVIGARDFLVAYNINLNTSDLGLAKAIAARIRESGRKVKKGAEWVRIPGRCKHVKAIGWLIPEFGFAQVSTNLIRIHETPPHEVFEATKEVALEMGVEVTGSELIGCIPLEPLKKAGKFYAGQIPNSPGSEHTWLTLAVDKLGLNQLSPFVLNERILEYIL